MNVLLNIECISKNTLETGPEINDEREFHNIKSNF